LLTKGNGRRKYQVLILHYPHQHLSPYFQLQLLM
jgi:hypothetical protein